MILVESLSLHVTTSSLSALDVEEAIARVFALTEPPHSKGEKRTTEGMVLLARMI